MIREGCWNEKCPKSQTRPQKNMIQGDCCCENVHNVKLLGSVRYRSCKLWNICTFLYFLKLLGSVRSRSCKLWNISYFAEKMTKMCTMPRMHLSPWGKWKLQIHVRTRKYNLRKKQYALKRNIIWNSPHLPEFEWSFYHFTLECHSSHSTDTVINSKWQLMNKHYV